MHLSAQEKKESSVDLSADFLIWKASEETSSIWTTVLKTEFIDDVITDTFNAKALTFGWDFGFRIGAGYQMEYDEWDIQLYWSWYRTQTKDSVPVDDHIVLSEFFAGFVIDRDSAVSGNIRWNILYNMFDWELGRNFWVSKNFSLRPYMGLKGGWIHQSIFSSWENFELNQITINLPSSENLKNNFWGIGPNGGINSQWNLFKNRSTTFNLFGNFSTASMWGTWVLEDEYENPLPREITLNLSNRHLGSLMLKGILGIGWDVEVNKGKSHFSTKLGYEVQSWFNQLRIPTFQILLLHGDLTLHGGTINCSFNY
jgi:hypothetical protein